jgi:hypothetical protein
MGRYNIRESLRERSPATAEGFCQMNDGEYYVSAENLAEDVQVGDIVTIWFNGMIQETYPAQLGVVYRIIKTQ